MRTAAVIPLRPDNHRVTAGSGGTFQSAGDRTELPPSALVHLRLSLIGWIAAGAGTVVVFLAIGFLVPLFGSLDELTRLVLINGPLVAVYL